MRAHYKQILERNVPEEMRIQYKSNCRWVQAGITEENPRSRQNFINTTHYFVDGVCCIFKFFLGQPGFHFEGFRYKVKHAIDTAPIS